MPHRLAPNRTGSYRVVPVVPRPSMEPRSYPSSIHISCNPIKLHVKCAPTLLVCRRVWKRTVRRVQAHRLTWIMTPGCHCWCLQNQMQLRSARMRSMSGASHYAAMYDSIHHTALQHRITPHCTNPTSCLAPTV
jgi:hypothetical protein